MKNNVLLLGALLVWATLSLAQEPPKPAAPLTAQSPTTARRIPPSAGSRRPLYELPYTPGLDLAAMDKAADPCVDFYQYTCGGWMKSNPIPPDQAAWNVYGKLQDENEQFLWGILRRPRSPAAALGGAARNRRLLRRLHGRGHGRKTRCRVLATHP